MNGAERGERGNRVSRGSNGPRNSSPASATRESQDQPLEKVLGGGMTYFALWLGFRCTGEETRDETMPALQRVAWTRKRLLATAT